jgi:hypothetical protein
MHTQASQARNDRQKRSLSALLDRGIVIWRSAMRSLYRGVFVHLDFLWRFSYLANAIIHVCFSNGSRPRDSDHPTLVLEPHRGAGRLGCPQKASANETLRLSLEGRGFVVEDGTGHECGCAVLARRREMNPIRKAA